MSETTTPPTPEGLPLVGNGVAFARDPIDAMESWTELGDLVRLAVPGRDLYLVTGPALIERILREDHEAFSIGPAQRETFAGVEDHAVTTTTGERWERLRRALRPAFTRERIRTYGAGMAATTAASVDRWADGQRFDLYREMRLLSVNVLADTLVGVDARGREDVVIAAADALVDRANFRRPGQLLPDWVPTPTERRFERAVRELDAFVDDIVAERAGADAGEAETDVAADLLAAHERGDLTMPEVRHNLVALLLAGHESPSAVLTHTWRLLSDHPAERERVRDECRAVLDGSRPDGDDYANLDHTRAVVREAMRLFPPTTGVNRQTTEPVTLGGYDLPAGAQLLMPQWVVHRDARFWTDPDTFDPDRWERDSDRPDFAYFPFSGGPRNCVGANFARQELTLTMATMLQAVDLDVTTDGPLSFTPSIQLRPENDIRATVRRR